MRLHLEDLFQWLYRELQELLQIVLNSKELLPYYSMRLQIEDLFQWLYQNFVSFHLDYYQINNNLRYNKIYRGPPHNS